MEIVFASRNKKKLQEVRRILADCPVTVLSLDEFPDCPEVVEDRDTFEGNAVKKAAAVAAYTGRLAFADDSGLEVTALNGAPGVYSARYAGEDADDVKNVQKLLAEMSDVPDGQRAARFVCCIALAIPGDEVHTFWGFVDGTIAFQPRGEFGFGYDPVFYPAGYESTFAEMSAEQKDALSHRRKALEKLAQYLKFIL